jgi:hypothetical protein
VHRLLCNLACTDVGSTYLWFKGLLFISSGSCNYKVHILNMLCINWLTTLHVLTLGVCIFHTEAAVHVLRAYVSGKYALLRSTRFTPLHVNLVVSFLLKIPSSSFLLGWEDTSPP